MAQGRSSFFIIILTVLITTISSLRADVVWEAVEVQCIPTLGHLKFTTTVMRGHQLLSLEREEVDELVITKGIIMDGRDASGQCQLGEDVFKWKFTDYHEPGKGQCGGGYWGGELHILINEEVLFDNTPFGGDHNWPCAGSSLQQITINEYSSTNKYEIHLSGYWEQSPGYTYEHEIDWPITEKLFSKWGICQPDYSKEPLEWCESEYVLIEYK